ncbi:glycosyltransferase family 2 protein [Paraconexibacter algicola]|uniref:Glycosyltransferase 2-like domain-containing protein n=1 Tax=Paraconexibacter algicola TaxID=2133960 RepID=A0A2T4UGT7_9ACTN|nr:glycosyltransferase family 2 protein [Paraconexibacter algicola]PTL58463.1 hypothetical protein C7Y72_01740 [Paraconexibacter algicola]
MSRRRLSACLITQDEEERLPAALASLAFCDEIVVVDSGSTDRTVELARAAGATVVHNPWPGFARQRNVALRHATGDWVVEIDADERVTPELAAELRAFLDHPTLPDRFPLLSLPRRNRFLGGWLRDSMKYPSYCRRMFALGVYEHDETRTVHEEVVPTTPAWAARGDITHELAGTWREALRDTWAYAKLDAAQFRPQLSVTALVRGVVLRPLVKAAYRLTLDGGWRDGWRGAARIALDTGTDAAVWLLAARAARRTGPDGAADATAGHYSERFPAVSAVRVVGVATSAGGAQRVTAWLAQAAAAGADATLLVPPSVAPVDLDAAAPPWVRDAVRVQALAGRGPVAIGRALDREEQVRPVELVVAADDARRATRLALRLVARGPAAGDLDAPAAPQVMSARPAADIQTTWR